jgi:hypothetical protein
VPVDRVGADSENDRRKIAHGNARRMFGIP